MPIYEYKCTKCGNQYELRLGLFHKKDSTKCPKCSDTSPERVFSGFATGSQAGNSCISSKFS
jgi:putative FmdB family regulatory protein